MISLATARRYTTSPWLPARRPPWMTREFDIQAPVTFVGTPMHTALPCSTVSSMPECRWRYTASSGTRGWLRRPDRNVQKTFDDIRAYGMARLRAEGSGALWAALASRLGGDQHNGGQRKIDASLLHGFLPDTNLAALFCHSKINLGFTRMAGDDPAQAGTTQVKLRDFEVPACGGFYLVEHAPEYADFFDPGPGSGKLADGRRIDRENSLLSWSRKRARRHSRRGPAACTSGPSLDAPLFRVVCQIGIG